MFFFFFLNILSMCICDKIYTTNLICQMFLKDMQLLFGSHSATFIQSKKCDILTIYREEVEV